MSTLRIIAAVICLLAFAGFVSAQDDTKKWRDEAEFSFVDTGGNTNVITLSVKNHLKYNFSEKWLMGWKIGALYGKSDDVKNAEYYYTDLRLDYSISDRAYAALGFGWMKDEFAGFKSHFNLGPTAGYKVLVGPKHFFNVEGGLDYVNEKYVTDESQSFMDIRALAGYDYAFTEKSKFTQTVEYIYNLDSSRKYYFTSNTALVSAINSWLSLKGSYEIKYNSKPVPDTLKKTDTILALALVVNF